MTKPLAQSYTFLDSLKSTENGIQDFQFFLNWFESKSKNSSFVVEEIPFELLDKWYFEQGTGNLKHATGKFFSVEGINVSTNFGPVQKWEQPIIIQPEIGILGFISRVINGTRYFLMQAKMEPGNINIIQLSPTVQATKSNYTKVHNGKLPKYLEYFIDRSKSRILIDSLQSEQGGRFLKKRNRNMVVEIYDDLPVDDDFIWLTLGEIKMALKVDNMVNMDTRSVLSTIPFFTSQELSEIRNNSQHPFSLSQKQSSESFADQLIKSAVSSSNSFSRLENVLSWLTEMKTVHDLNVTIIPLCNVIDWCYSDYSIRHERKPFFSIIAVKVQAGTREILCWTQPLLKEVNIGMIGFVVKNINGILHFLVQAKVEPGSLDIVDIAPTVSCSNYEYAAKNPDKPPFLDLFINPDPGSVILSSIQSEEGGRFFHFQNKNMIIKVEDDALQDIPFNYTWLTLGQIFELLKYGFMNVEFRSLISTLSIL
jgi:dTDP-4-dehydro-6-deoxy-alpha-D-glucopyranose 2,3-dehydratase